MKHVFEVGDVVKRTDEFAGLMYGIVVERSSYDDTSRGWFIRVYRYRHPIDHGGWKVGWCCMRWWCDDNDLKTENKKGLEKVA